MCILHHTYCKRRNCCLYISTPLPTYNTFQPSTPITPYHSPTNIVLYSTYTRFVAHLNTRYAIPFSAPSTPSPDFAYPIKISRHHDKRLSADEFDEIQTRNKNVCSSAIARAVQDATAGQFVCPPPLTSPRCPPPLSSPDVLPPCPPPLSFPADLPRWPPPLSSSDVLPPLSSPHVLHLCPPPMSSSRISSTSIYFLVVPILS